MIKKMIFSSILLFFTNNSNAQHSQFLKTPPLSPRQTIKQDFGIYTNHIEISYSRPGKKGRMIYGELVPYGKIWRTGANNATTISFSDTVVISKKKIPPGKYGLLTIPNKENWTVIITKSTDIEHPEGNYNQEDDILRITVNPIVNNNVTIETFTIGFANIKPASLDLQFWWENIVINIPISIDIESIIKQQINVLSNTGNRKLNAAFINEAADYFINNDLDPSQALVWFDKSFELSNSSLALYNKAIVLKKLDRISEAIMTAQLAMKLAQKEGNYRTEKQLQKLLVSLNCNN